MIVINGEIVDAISIVEYRKRFPEASLCCMCPITGKNICNCPLGKVYVKNLIDIVWRT